MSDETTITNEGRDELAVVEKVTGWVKAGYEQNPTATDKTLAIALNEAIGNYAGLVYQADPTPEELEQVKSALGEGSELVKGISAIVTNHVDGARLGQETLGLVVAQVTGALRLHPKLLKNDMYQHVITAAFGMVTDIADLASDTFYLGENAVNQDAHNAIGEYFAAVPLNPSLREMQGIVTPATALMTDWGAAVAYCRGQGVPEQAFLRDGTNLFRFAPNALPYVAENQDKFPGLELHKVNNGSHVEGWLTSAKIGKGEGMVPIQSWQVLLTGYTPKDNAVIPGFSKRYSAARVSTALDVQNNRGL